MTFISYSQNFEDVMLWRALKHIKNGFYIDVGANHPEEDSVTKSFYENGWSGINIEPEKEFYELLEDDRPKDINLNIAISANVNSIDFFVSKVRGWSTTDTGNSHNLKDKDVFNEVRNVQAMSLDKLIMQHNIKKVHFLKVDVEGAEKDVLESLSFKKIRPWVVLVEATKPATLIDISSEWEHILFENNYKYAYFDGINKYYIDEQHLDLLSAFKYPPNVFDEFALVSEVRAEAKAREAEAKAREAEAKAGEAEAKAGEAEAKAREAEAQVQQTTSMLQMVYNSRSWSITLPLRWVVHQARLLKQHGFFARIKSLVKKITRPFVRRGITFVNSRPGLRQRCLTLARRLGLYESLRDIYLRFSGRTHQMPSAPTQPHTAKPKSPEDMTPNARRIYADLKASIAKRKEEGR